MGFWNNLFDAAQKAAMSQFGIERPRDAISFVERLIDRNFSGASPYL
ncbi:MAG: hypothetical protein IKN30_06605 [Synergistaceae bacterium]|nr:hypothetical protein [Synergistaceae bacterium]